VRSPQTIVFICAFVVAAPAAPADVPKVPVALQPLGGVDAAFVAKAKEAITIAFNAEVTVLPDEKLPAEAWYAARGRHRAEKILDWLDAHTDAKYAKVVGLTQKDISTTKDDVYDWGIFGLGSLGGRPCVISTFRLKRNATPLKLAGRLEKVVVHEVGHTLGLPHCETKGCIMQDAKGTIKTVDAETLEFCAACRARLNGKKEGL
jgi:archaemetzincin